MIEVKRAGKNFGNRLVINDCSMTIDKGEIYALVGVNGAGKTTLMKMAAGFLQPSMGAVYVKGVPAWENKESIQRLIGSLIEVPVFYEHLTAVENLKLHQAYMDCQEDISAILGTVGLSENYDKPVAEYSMGMRQRLAIARAMLHKPDILILDEPLNGLDPLAVEEMRVLLRKKADEGVAILISSHILSDVLQIADRVGVLSKGRIKREFVMQEYKEQSLETFSQEVLGIMKGEA